jgi:F-type H+-transporting ATPase subunit c
MISNAADLVAMLNGQVAFAAALMIALPAMAGSIGITLLGSKYLECLARQPEISSLLTTRMFTLAAMIDGIAIIGMGMGMLLMFMNPFLTALEKIIAA